MAGPIPARDAHRDAYRRLGGRDDDPAFRLTHRRVSGDRVELGYAIDGLGPLVETVELPGLGLEAATARPAVRGALVLLHLAAATSYYKAAIPPRVVVPDVPGPAREMLRALLTHGLAEFATRNGFDLTDHVRLEPAGEALAPAPAVDRPDPVLVPLGGGKDSAVTAALAVREGWDAAGFAVNPRDSMRRTAAAVGVELVGAQRRIDPALLELNDRGALNGHVPITAIVASVACLAATVTGRGDVLLSNEASADEPTRTVDGRAVNHQYSKSSAFERLHAAAAATLTGGATRALSVLRPLPELLVAAAFSHLGAPEDLLPAVNSCNRAYSLTRAGTEWCGACDKCRFVQLMLAPFRRPGSFTAATGFDALADPAQVDAFGDLLDPARKPYECVGTVEEVQLAFDLLADDPDWADHVAVRRFGRAGADARRRLVALTATVDPGTLPRRYGQALGRVVDELAA